MCVWLPPSLFTFCSRQNYQTLEELKRHSSERRTMALVCKLEKYMMQLVQIMHKVTELTDKYQEKSAEKWGK
ncbi:MAG: hypothetical protein VZR53_12325 [Prevotella sp.]|nr:hypothetical protein [Prevotella sp.]